MDQKPSKREIQSCAHHADRTCIIDTLRNGRLNGKRNYPVPAETELAELLEKVGYDKVELNNEQIQMESGGMIDLGAVGKGYAGDEAAQILLVMGLENAQGYWRQRRNFEMILIMEDGDIYLTEGIRDSFSLNSEYRNMKINVID